MNAWGSGMNGLERVGGSRLGRRDFVRLLGAAIGTGGLTASGVALGADASTRILKIGAEGNPSSLDPATGGSGSDHVFLFTLYDTLVTWGYEDLLAKPGLAESWTFPDPQTLVLKLRRGVKFHDGTPFNAEAVKINLDRNRAAEFSNIRADLGSVDSVTVEDEYAVALHLKNPDTALPLILSDRAGMMVSPKALEENGNRVDRVPVGTGFMRFEKWDDGSLVALRAFDGYYDPARIGVGGIDFIIMLDAATRLRAAISGQVEAAYALTGRQKALVEKSPRLQAITGTSLFCFQIYLNMAKKPLDDARVRQALNYAVDREALVRAAMAGTGEPAYMNLPERHWAWDPETAALYRPNPEKARALLAEAGYPDGISLDLASYAEQSWIQMQEVLLDQFEKAGIKARFHNGQIEMASVYFAQREHDGFLAAWTGRPDPSLSYALMYTQDSFFNAGKVAPPEGFTEALLQSRSNADVEERKAALARVQRIVMEQALVLPIAFREDIIAASASVKGLRSNLLGKPKFKDVTVAG